MKKIFFIAGCLLLAVLFQQCSPEDYKEVGDAANRVEELGGKWKVTKVIQQDPDAVENGFPYKQTDVTSVGAFTSSTLTLNVSAGKPTTFTADKASAPFFLPVTQGNWSVDNEAAPKVIGVTSGSTTVNMELGPYVLLSDDKMQLTVYRKQGDAVVIAYIYEFVKI